MSASGLTTGIDNVAERYTEPDSYGLTFYFNLAFVFPSIFSAALFLSLRRLSSSSCSPGKLFKRPHEAKRLISRLILNR